MLLCGLLWSPRPLPVASRAMQPLYLGAEAASLKQQLDISYPVRWACQLPSCGGMSCWRCRVAGDVHRFMHFMLEAPLARAQPASADHRLMGWVRDWILCSAERQAKGACMRSSPRQCVHLLVSRRTSLLLLLLLPASSPSSPLCALPASNGIMKAEGFPFLLLSPHLHCLQRRDRGELGGHGAGVDPRLPGWLGCTLPAAGSHLPHFLPPPMFHSAVSEALSLPCSLFCFLSATPPQGP